MPEDVQWQHVEAAGVELDVPAELTVTSDQGLEGPAAVLEGGNMRLTLDGSAFADPLSGHREKPGFTQWRDEVYGEEREFVSFLADEDTQIFASRLPGFTATVQMERSADPEIAKRILRSIRPRAQN